MKEEEFMTRATEWKMLRGKPGMRFRSAATSNSTPWEGLSRYVS